MIDLERSNRQRFGYEAVSSHVAGIERIYSKSHIRITHQLLNLINDAKDLAAQCAEGNIVETDMNKLFKLRESMAELSYWTVMIIEKNI